MKIAFAFCFVPFFALAQPKDKPKENWQNLDLQRDGVMGISTEKAYELLKGKKSSTVIVAVIDGGVDEEHEDLKANIWKNTVEIAGNEKDDDKNGYVDDVYGWNFIGSSIGNVHYDNLEVVRLVRELQDKYASVVNSTPLTAKERKEFNQYKKMITDYMTRLDNARRGYDGLSVIKKTTEEIVSKMNKTAPTLKDFDRYKAANEVESKVLKVIKSEMKRNDYKAFKKDIDDTYKYYTSQVNYHLNMDFDPRDSVKDNYSNAFEKIYGNADITGPDAEHGTHVAGIIGAVRGNGIGINGIADNVKIMGVRTVPDGDERDKDVANAIRYAVDNGAKVINMSFGKGYVWNKAVVDSAVKYAESRDVLLVHAAGNDGKNTDIAANFPNRIYGDITPAERPPLFDIQARQTQGMGGMPRSVVLPKIAPDTTRFSLPSAQNWIEVGASSWKNNEDLVAGFSNYGKRSVDVFAPGVQINSTTPGSEYEPNDGTSMASPVVAGLAALIRSYYPTLTAVQVKDIIMKSVTKVNHKVKIKEDGATRKVKLDEISISGGVVNAYNALQLASQMSNASL